MLIVLTLWKIIDRHQIFGETCYSLFRLKVLDLTSTVKSSV